MPNRSALAGRIDPVDDLEDFAGSLEPLCWLDGIITAVAVGPQGVTAAEWLSVIWDIIGVTADTEWMKPPLESYFLQARNQTAEIIRRAPSLFVPKFEGMEDELAGAAIWAGGFRDAMGLRPAAWRSLTADPDHRRYVGPIMMLSLDDSELRGILRPQAPRRSVDLDEVRRECVEELAECLAGLYRYWHGRHSALVQAIGRNDPCPCGSGRKYKKCCRR